jgi:SAM-dependent methyltransferase
MSARLVCDDGTAIRWHVERWMAPVSKEERALLEFVVPPVLDVGCGPGRHVVALAEKGIVALGVDVSGLAVHAARGAGAAALQRSVFDRIPGAGRWGTALLLDGNVGIGGAPRTLLRRLRGLIRAGGRALVEVAAPGSLTKCVMARIECNGSRTAPFHWALVAADDIGEIGASSGFATRSVWVEGGRWFAQLDAR